MGIQVMQTLVNGKVFPGDAAPTGGNDWYSHNVWAPQARTVEWQVNVETPTGSPTSGRITAEFQIYVPNYLPNASMEQVANVKWVTVGLDTHSDLFDGDDWPLSLMEFDGAAATLTHRRLRTLYPHRLHLVSTFAGGTNPGARITARMHWSN